MIPCMYTYGRKTAGSNADANHRYTESREPLPHRPMLPHSRLSHSWQSLATNRESWNRGVSIWDTRMHVLDVLASQIGTAYSDEKREKKS